MVILRAEKTECQQIETFGWKHTGYYRAVVYFLCHAHLDNTSVNLCDQV